MFIWLLFVLLFHVRNACFFACVGIIQAIIRYPIRERSLPFSPPAAALLLLLLSACCTSCLGPINFRVGCDEALLKKLSSIVGFGYSWECIDDGGWSLRFDWNPFMCWLVGCQSFLIETPFSSVGWTSFKLSTISINYLLLLGNPSSCLVL